MLFIDSFKIKRKGPLPSSLQIDLRIEGQEYNTTC